MITVASWNVNSVVARFERLQGFLERLAPDVVLLQELKCLDEKFPFEPIESLGYTAAVFCQKTYNGVAILSRKPLTDIKVGFGNQLDGEARIISAYLGEVLLVSAYVPNGRSVGSEAYQYKLEWLKYFHDFLQSQVEKGTPMIVAGDFNIAPSDLDVYDPEAFANEVLFSEPEKKAFWQIIDLGLNDTLRHFHPSEKIFSWWDYRQLAFPKNRGARIDFVLASKDIMTRCQKAWVEREERKGQKPSDHAPVMATFDL